MPPIVLLFFSLNTLYLTRCDVIEPGQKLSIINGNVTSDESVTETQHATCKIATEELVATARATFTRVLTGACNAKTVDEKLTNLETNLTRQLEDIKSLLYALLDSEKDLYQLREISRDVKNVRSINYNQNPAKDYAVSPRQSEVDQFNGTVQKVSTLNGSENSFIYYWQINDFDEKLASWKTARSERSSTFYVGQAGYAMYIKVTPRYFPDGTVFVGVGLTRGRHDSVLRWPFPLKIRLEILDHSPQEKSRQDRRSRIWDPATLCSEYFWGRPKLIGEADNPECVGLSVSRQVLFSKLSESTDLQLRNTRYLWNGSITIKLIVYS